MNRRMIGCVALVLLACGGIAAEEISDEERIREVRSSFNDAIARHDVEAILTFLDEEYQITTGSGNFSRGRDAERKNLEDVFSRSDDVVYVRTPERIEVSPSLPHAFEEGTWNGSWTHANGVQRYRGRYAAYWRKVDGAWRVRSELFVTIGCEGPECPGSSIQTTPADRDDVTYFAREGSPYPFSEAVRVGRMLYLSGRIGTDPETGELVSGGIEAETRQTMDNIGRTLEKYGSSFDRVVKCTVMLDDMAEWPAMNEVYRTYFTDHYPARSALGADGLALGARVEIECWATVE